MGKSSGGNTKKNDPLTATTATRVLRNRKIGGESSVNTIVSDEQDSSAIESTADQSSKDPPMHKEQTGNSNSNGDDTNVSPGVNDKQVEKESIKVHNESSDSEYEDNTSEPIKTQAPDDHGKVNVLKDKAVTQTYLDAAGGSKATQKVNFRDIEQSVTEDADYDVILPINSVKEANSRYKNTLYGYFLGRRVAFPVVQHYAFNAWKKFGIEKVMMNAKEFFFFTFDSEAGLMVILENGPCMIRNMPIILNKWTSDVSLTKEDLTKVPVWVKLYDVPLAGFTEEGLSVIATKFGKPMKLDSYTSTMYREAWGHPNFARTMIEVSSERELREDLKVATPSLEGKTNLIDVVKTEYEWKPPRCSGCCVFGHTDAQCPKNVKVVVVNEKVDNDGFKTVGKQKPKLDNRKQIPCVDEPTDVEDNDDETARFVSNVNSEGASTPVLDESHVALTNLNRVGNSVFPTWSWASNASACIAGSANCTIVMREFKECVDSLCLSDVNHTGFQFTWNQRPQSNDGILKKIDRVMANNMFIDQFTNVVAIFQPYRISDHSPAVLQLPCEVGRRRTPFRFSNYLINHELFSDTVKEGWKMEVNGHAMFKLVKKVLDQAQTDLDTRPVSPSARANATITLKEFNDAVLDEESFLKQKSKIKWLRVDDNNSSYFHKVVKRRTNRSRIHIVYDLNGNTCEGQAVPVVFVNHYKNFLGTADMCTEIDTPGSLFQRTISSTKLAAMISPISAKEICDAIFDIGDSKSPGPDGFSATFFKKSWYVIGPDVIKAVQEFFLTGQIKIIVSRIKASLDDIVNINQSAFIPGCNIADNILLTQELMRNYHLNRGTPRCAFKVDIQKAYDTIDWEFLHVTLICFGFPSKMVDWIMKCVSSTSYSININGELHGFFQGKRGLRQGDSLSPYLFTLVMEVLSLILQRNICKSKRFRCHPKCDKLKIINLCFADDLFLFSHANNAPVHVIRDSLKNLQNAQAWFQVSRKARFSLLMSLA
ncbi:uncharacterized protein [Rutidosis leptorrhynchoides]|uniref:uncharacterized protein n=1 Tax=Rutidosis leptorrhynchoides TaxID=125765 RepID=UPI003A99036E